ncbi:MAG: hypothetical protein WCC92_02985 [Candidatus Korobacteraceae bacterium]
MGAGAKVELTFDPGDLGHINVFDPLREAYIRVPAVDQAYAGGLSIWQNKVIRRYAQCQLNARTDIVALAQAKAEIRALVERDFNRKTTRGRKRHARFMEDHTRGNLSEVVATESTGNAAPNCLTTGAITDGKSERRQSLAGVSAAPNQPAAPPDALTDDTILPVFEAGFDLPQRPVAAAVAPRKASGMKETA